MPRYNPATIEPKWQQYWQANRTFAAPACPPGPKIYVLDMFPYPSGNGLHVGHPEGYTATDITCRYHRMRGRQRAAPDGLGRLWLAGRAARHSHRHAAAHDDRKEHRHLPPPVADAGLQLRLGPRAEHDRHRLFPLDAVDLPEAVQLLVRRRAAAGAADRRVADPGRSNGRRAKRRCRRYRDEHRLAYQLEAPVNWCPNLGTVLSNEEVKDGLSERGGHPVVRIPLRQWMLRITAYAERLEKDLEQVDWSEGIKALQRNWIGRSTGAEVDFWIAELRPPLRAAAAFDDMATARRNPAFRASPATTCCASTRRVPTRSSARRTW